MKLTNKDKEFLRTLRVLLDEKQLHIQLKDDGFKRFRLCQNYGDRIEREFGVTRQGVRWRFNHVFNEIYVEALMSVLMVESEYGASLRNQAISIAKDRIELFQEAMKRTKITLPRRETQTKTPVSGDPESTSATPS